ncbi:nuclear factor 7, ovary-like [Hyla sarda]|uniref:nuclear factor 7, ovary-like n=1 Tax=Hyla sarda TaxID=327740 RepID=UPI0024C25B78|nr:nuclear factor 7, ovary-like [Hyla sarda]XP_056406197.1 nuclear factor 7, ovary-like [Hyla sarda]XP_056406198.1 nuclear factor 7, ovary-like [Hyla sarda]XP_056406199.1 nuclear factor 7, ovary-like [Hyla sarda]XP_056406200.1 nuclear factor 7, ovary-like [Hyla sarda]XP_056406201.1 nuclear factor 7, ovary-like [Hyla sarda]XP_056406204.1 nuclear factor 7, ovary-like [Hyla sarda]XP_056406205.1 nuclear factor 7, ovary-like [Hyla sarda]XP_056406206.1 nuclear factor 7, ovary-like [Hyla sarda]XP
MASAALKDELTCPICLNLFTDPVTLQCGHNFCQECMKNFIDTRMLFEPYTCPQCRAKFQERPTLQRNTALRNIVDHLLFQEDQEGSEVFCTYCDCTPVVASKTCMWCKASLCDLHLTAHSKSPEHVLIQPTKSFSNIKCTLHNMVLMYYCTNDTEFLCVSCCLGEKHRGHQVELLDKAAKKEQEKLRTIQENIIKERKNIEKKVQNLQDHLMQITGKAAGIVERVNVKFRDLRMKLDNLDNHVLNEIYLHQAQASQSVSDLIQQLESKKDSLSRKISTIEDLCQINDPLLYLQADKPDFAGTTGFGDNSLNEAADLAEDLIFDTLNSGMISIIYGLQKGYYVQEASDILLDVNTASNDVQISDDLKTASWSAVNQGRPKTHERFAIRRVLSMKGFSDCRLYWDVEVSKAGGWRVGMTYHSIERIGKYSLIGNNNKSWGLRSFNKQYSVKHDGKQIPLACRPSCYKVRIYLDYTAGLLSFYELDNSLRHLYTYSTSFTDALYPVIAVWASAWVKVLH